MKKLILIFSLCCFVAGSMFGQCPANTSAFGSGTVNNAGTIVTLTTCAFAGEYSTVNGTVAGQSLKFTSTGTGDILTVRSGSANGPVVAFGTSPLSFVNTFTGTLFLHYNTSTCGTQSTCRTGTVQCVSCVAPPPVDPCLNPGSISCGVSQAVTIAAGTGVWNPASCGFSTPGNERVFTFTAPYTGIYTFNVTAASGGFVDWFFKSASAGCGSTGWTCIDDIFSPTSVTFSLTAGTYFFLADPEGTTGASQTFNISCTPPVDPCNTIGSATCGVSQSVTLTGTGGGWNPQSCGFTTPGAEQVYTFTAPTTGTYTFNVTSATGGFIDWFFKPTSAGCGPTGWTCIDDIFSASTVTFSLTAGTYFILADGEGTAARSQTWNIGCPSPAPANDLCAGAIALSCGGANVSGNTINATADVAPSCNGFTVGTGGAVWYSVVGNGGFLTATTCNVGTNYDTKLHVYDGSCGALNCVTANDDDFTCSTGGLRSTVTWCAAAGTTYYILVNGFGSAQGNFELSLNCTQPTVTINPVAPLCQGAASVTLSANIAGGSFSGPGVSGNSFNPATAGVGVHTITYSICSITVTTTITVLATPANDLVANAEPMACGSSVSGNTTCATSETLGTCGTTDGTGGGVWYSIVGNGNKITLSTCSAGTDYDTKIRVFDGSPSALNCVTGNDDDFTCATGPGTAGFKSKVTFCSVAGTTYYVLVHGFGSGVGNFTMSSDCSPVAPTIVCSGPVSGNLDANCSFVVGDYTGLGAANDDCAGVVVSQSPAAGSSVSGAGATTITLTATDAGGNTATCTIALNLTDITAPSAVCQDVTVFLDNAGNASVTAVDVNNGSADACGIASTTIDNGSFNCSNTTTTNTVTLTVTDVNGLSSTCTSTVTVIDNEDPTITCLDAGIITGPNTAAADISVNNDPGICGAVVNYDSYAAADNCSFTVAQTTGLVSGSTFPVGTTNNTFVVTDASGNTAACNFNVIVTDVEAPVAVCQNVTVDLDAAGQGSTNASAVDNGSTDNCAIASISLSNTSFTCANVGANPVVLTVTDIYGNASNCSAVVSVRDLVAPVITCPANIVVSAPSGQCSRTVTFSVTSTDACGSSVVSTPASGSVFYTGTTTVNSVATDVNGNTSACSFTVRVIGVNTITIWGVPCNTSALCSSIPAAPAIVACPAPGNGGSGSGSHGSGSGSHGSGSGSHGSGSGSHVCNYAAGSGSGSGNYHGFNGIVTNPCGAVGNNGSCGSGGSGSGSNCNTYCVRNSCGVYATSLCGPCPTVVMTTTTIPGSCANNYTLRRTWTATDIYGNTISQSQDISVYDNVRPSINCPNNITVCVPNSNTVGRTVTYTVTASDNCGVPTITTTKASGTLFAIGNTNVTATATDACGNTRTCTFRVRVERRNNCNSKTEGEPEAGEEEVMPTLSINAYPNPTNGLLEVEIFCQDCNGDITYPLTVTDLFGKVIVKRDVMIAGGTASVKLDLSDYASGVYMINVNNLFTRVMKQ